MPDDVPRDMPHMCREFPGRRTFIPSNSRTGRRCSLYAASERRPTSGGVPLLPRGRGPRSSPPAARAGGPGGVWVVPLNRFCGRGPGRPRRRAAGPPKTGRGGAIQGRSRPLAACRCGRPAGAGTVRGPGIKPGWRAVAGPVGRRAGGQGRVGLELPAARSLRISGPKDKKFRSRSGGGCREAGPGGCREAGPGPVPASRTGRMPGSRTGTGSGQQDRGRFRPAGPGPVPASRKGRRVPAQKNRGRFRRTQPGRFRQAGSAGRFRRQEQARRTRPPGPDRLKSSNG